MSYGIKVQETNDPFIELAENTISNLVNATLPGTFLADTFYWLRHIPEGFPATGWKAKVRELRREMHECMDTPFEAALGAIVRNFREFLRRSD